MKAAVIVQILILVGVLAGVAALARDVGIRSPINVSLHAVMLALIVIGLSLLAISRTRAGFRSTEAA